MREIVLDTETTGLDPFQGHRVVVNFSSSVRSKFSIVGLLLSRRRCGPRADRPQFPSTEVAR